MEKFQNESDAAFKIRWHLADWYGCKFEPTHKAHFFSNTWKNDQDEQIIVFFLDSVYAALQAPEKKVALRAYVQACEYSAENKYRYLRYHHETAFHEAKMRIESFLEGC